VRGVQQSLHPSGVASPATSAKVQPFVPANGANNPRTYARARRRGSARREPAGDLREQPVQPAGPGHQIRIIVHKIGRLDPFNITKCG
jgi:hypothetical protein